MRSFKLPFSYTVNGEIEIQASSLELAIERFNEMKKFQNPVGHFPILDKATKLEPDAETLEVDEIKAEKINPLTRFKVEVTRTQTAHVWVEAFSQEDAEEQAQDKIENGDFEEDIFQDEDIEITEVEEIED